jgi:hypothetical protein
MLKSSKIIYYIEKYNKKEINFFLADDKNIILFLAKIYIENKYL